MAMAPANPYPNRNPNPSPSPSPNPNPNQVGLGDGPGYTNPTLALATCRADGTLLQPDKPLTALDETFWWGAAEGGAPEGRRLLGSHATLSGSTWLYILAVDLPQGARVVRVRVGVATPTPNPNPNPTRTPTLALLPCPKVPAWCPPRCRAARWRPATRSGPGPASQAAAAAAAAAAVAATAALAAATAALAVAAAGVAAAARCA